MSCMFPGNDLSKYASLFMEHDINGKRLLLLTQNELWKMGITSIGHRVDIIVS